jgi:small-conductance mechanosensitive channel
MMTVTPGFADQLAGIFADSRSWIESHTTQIVIAALVGTCLVALLYALRLLGGWLLGRDKAQGHWPIIVGKALARTRFWFMAAVAAKIIAILGKPPEELGMLIHVLFTIASALQVAVWARALILGIVEYRAQEADPAGNLGSAVGLIRLFTTVVLFLLAAILILSNLGVDVTGLVAGLGIGGIAIGLAAQGIFSDLFAALTILFDKPFRRGDLVSWDQTTGTVEYIGLKSSRVRALSGEEVIISNANLLGKELRNFARLETRRISQLLSLESHTPPEVCEKMADVLQPAIDGCEGCAFQRVGLSAFGASSLDFTLVFDVTAPDPADVLARRHAANIAILRAFANAGIAFAYPTQTTYTAAPDGRMVMPYATPSEGNIVKRQK